MPGYYLTPIGFSLLQFSNQLTFHFCSFPTTNFSLFLLLSPLVFCFFRFSTHRFFTCPAFNPAFQRLIFAFQLFAPQFSTFFSSFC